MGAFLRSSNNKFAFVCVAMGLFLAFFATGKIAWAAEAKATTSIENASISVEDQTWTGSPIAPDVEVTLNGQVLTANTDYSVDFSNNTDVGTAKVVVTGMGNYSGVATATFNIKKQTEEDSTDDSPDSSTQSDETLSDSTRSFSSQSTGSTSSVDSSELSIQSSTTATVDMYRLYNPNSGEHFYTKDSNERDYLVALGWTAEGVGWVAPASSSTPVYRLYNPNAGDHHYTVDWNEKEHLVSVGWRYEGIGWYSDDAHTVAVYRQYNPNAVAGAHNFTTLKAENDNLVSIGWWSEGVGWYAVAEGKSLVSNSYIYLDAGHGWSSGIYDSGASGSGYIEAQQTSELAYKVAYYARTWYGLRVFVNTDEGSSKVSYEYRQADAKQRGCTALVSIHFNWSSGGATGSESYIHSINANYRSAALQTIMHTSLVSSLGLFDRGKKSAQLAVVSGKDNGLPAVLLEICFINNSYDMSVYKSKEDKVAQALAKGLYNAAQAGY
jgi:N-acetylmuramoyl-L-alanine amidase